MAASLVRGGRRFRAQPRDYRRRCALGAGRGTLPIRRPLPRATPEPADVRRPGRRQDAPLPGRSDIPRTQPALVRGASFPCLPGRSLAGNRPLRRALHLVRMRLPRVRARPPVHLRSRRGTLGVQARLGLPDLVPVLLRGGAMVCRGPAQPAIARLAPRCIGAHLLRRLVAGARREHAEIRLQERPRTHLSGTNRAKNPLGRRAQRTLQRLLGGCRDTSITWASSSWPAVLRSLSAGRSSVRGSTPFTTSRYSFRENATTTGAARGNMVRCGSNTGSRYPGA